MSVGRRLSVKTQQQKSSMENTNDFISRQFTVSGEVQIENAGEAVFDVNFPVVFTMKPLFSFGADMVDPTLTIGNFPTVSAIVQYYDIDKSGINRQLYKGARIIVVSAGAADHKFWLHWHFTGQAVVNPIAPTSTTDDSI